MHREDTSNYLLYIEPRKEQKYANPVNDELTEIVERALAEAKVGTASYSVLEDNGTFSEGNAWKGWHTTDCGEHSGNRDYLLKNGMITNSFAQFYVRWYRGSIPVTEMKKLLALKAFYENYSK